MDGVTDHALSAEALTRTFSVRGAADRTALDAIDLALPVGGVHGLLGPNGAGKTTLCRIASTVLTPTSGHLAVQGADVAARPAEVRRQIGIVFGGDRGLYGRLTARENLEFWCAMNGVPRRATGERVTTLLERLGLAGRAEDLVETFSRGMKQRLHLARGLVGDPRLLVLDEPTVGMDPVSAHEFRSLVGELRSEGRTVLLTTHDMAEAQALCDTVTFIDVGRIVGSGTPETVRAMQSRGGMRIRVHEVSAEQHQRILDQLLVTLPGDGPARVTGTHDARARHTDLLLAEGDVSRAVATVLACGHPSVTTGAPSLEDVYLGLLGRRGEGDRGMAV